MRFVRVRISGHSPAAKRQAQKCLASDDVSAISHSQQPAAYSAADYQPLVVVLVAACTGIVVDRYWGLALFGWLIACAAGLLAWWMLWRRDRVRMAVWPLLVAVAAVAGGWHHCRWSLFDADEVSLLAATDGGPAAIEARVVGGPRRIPAPPYNPLYLFATPERTRMEIEVLAVRDDDRWHASTGRTTLFVNGLVAGVQAGDRVRIFGQLSPTRAPANPGEYDFAARARVDRRLCWLSAEFPECVSAIAHGSAWNWHRVLSFLRDQGDALLWRNLRGKRSALAAAMFLGSREELQPEETQAFLETGTIHLLVISGLNVGILAGCLFFVLRVALVPRRWALLAVVAASILYAATTDAQPPVVRATVMVLVACTAATLGRRALAYNSIAAAGLIVLALNPEELFQSGTQLSFLCVGALAWLAQKRYWRREQDPLDRLIARTRPWPVRAMRQIAANSGRLVVASVVIWLVVCPLVMARFHLVSPIAIVLGPILSVPVAIAMATGFGIFAIGWLIPPLAAGLGFVCDANLAFMQTSVEWGRAAPGNHYWVAGPSDWWLAVFYGALAVWALVPRWTPPGRWCVGVLSGWIALGLAIPLAAPRDDARLAGSLCWNCRGGRRSCTTRGAWALRPAPRAPWPVISGRAASRTSTPW
jgi:competence protein ComEC